MSSFTTMQEKAIFARGKNILVSAGAGSGKTTVLSQRVISLLKEGYTLDRLLILTFTRNAAINMKEKIRTLLEKETDLKAQIPLIDGADIETFDSFNQKLVRKYRRYLDLSADFTLVNTATFIQLKRDILKERFLDHYRAKDADFFSLLEEFTERDDEAIVDFIIRIDDALELIPDSENYLLRALEGSAEPDFELIYGQLFQHYQRRITFFVRQVEEMGLGEGFTTALQQLLAPALEAGDYASLRSALFAIKRLPSLKDVEEEVRDRYKDLVESYYRAVRKEIGETVEQTAYEAIYRRQAPARRFILGEVAGLRERLAAYKRDQAAYDFSDIAALALRLLKEQPEVLQEVKEHYREIMVDEYQDNSDLQEEVIGLLDDGNLFLVGDIKQSIYRFRHANPHLFARRYARYRERPELGEVIDMNTNFRSSPAVVDEINTIFSQVMTADFGGADYAERHLITAGNPLYQKASFKNRLLLMSGEKCRAKEKSRSEIEAVAADILHRVKSEKLSFSSFALLIDRGGEFGEIVRIFAERGIPLDVSLNGDLISYNLTELLIDLLQVLASVEAGDLQSVAFKHAFFAISRSFVFQLRDDDILDVINGGKIAETELIKSCVGVLARMKNLPLDVIFRAVLAQINFVEKTLSDRDFDQDLKLLESFIGTLTELSRLHCDLPTSLQYFKGIKKSGVRYLTRLETKSKNAVTLTNIHMAKGLEYDHCYYLHLTRRYNEQDSRAKFKFSARYGLLLPIVAADFKTEGINISAQRSPLDRAFIIDERKEDKSERLRLLYVALTRAKKTMTFVEEPEHRLAVLAEDNRCFDEVLALSGTYQRAVPVLLTEPITALSAENPTEISNCHFFYFEAPMSELEAEPEERRRASKTRVQRSAELLKKGERLHEILQCLDLRRPNLEFIRSAEDRRLIEGFLHLPFLGDLEQAKIYQEYEFFDEVENLQGAIDLLLVYPDRAKIVDYKLKDVADEAYRQQLLCYKSYVERITALPVELYLYSLVDGVLVDMTCPANCQAVLKN